MKSVLVNSGPSWENVIDPKDNMVGVITLHTISDDA